MKGQTHLSTFFKPRSLIDPIKQKKIDEALVNMTIMMNRPFNDVENHYFRALMFVAEPNYICPSAKKHTTKFDAMAVQVKEKLKKEITKDVTEAGHKTIVVISDHGKSGDKFQSKENAVVVARTNKDYVIKKDIVIMLKCTESQSGKQIRTEVKNALIERAGYDESWKVNWVTDGEKKQLNATDPTKHSELNMKITHRGKCVDHTLELVSEDSIKQVPEMNEAVKKVRKLVNFMKDSSLARVAFNDIMIAAGVTPIAIIQGTENRWFYKYSEVRRALELKETIETFFETYNIPENLSSIEEEDWAMLMVYENAMRAIVEAAKVLEGELYPTASSVIPFLDTIIEDLKKLSNKVKLGVERNYVNTLLTNLQSNQRFPDGYKCETPYNILTLLDPRHSDLYFNEEQ